MALWVYVESNTVMLTMPSSKARLYAAPMLHDCAVGEASLLS